MQEQEQEPEKELRVEISGWDLSEQFFVERGTLLEQADDAKMVTLHHEVRVGGLIFLRLLENTQPSMSFPVAYRVREIRATGTAGSYNLSLRQMWPRPEPTVRAAALRVDSARPEWLGMK